MSPNPPRGASNCFISPSVAPTANKRSVSLSDSGLSVAITTSDLPRGDHFTSFTSQFGPVSARSFFVARSRIRSRACRSSLSATCESSFSFSFFCSSSDFASAARNAISCPSGAHSNAPMLSLLLVSAAASPPSTRITKICCWSPPRPERNASCFPSGDHRGDVSDFSE